jgi:hypothetical protein
MQNIVKLPFQIIQSSGWEDGFPPTHLHIQHHQPSALGWHSQKYDVFRALDDIINRCRFCLYPQILVLRLASGKSRIRKIQILSHHYMISTRIDLFVGNVIPQKTAYGGEVEDISNAIQFNRLGYVIYLCLKDEACD